MSEDIPPYVLPALPVQEPVGEIVLDLDAAGAVVAKRRAKVDPLRDTYNRTLRVQIRCHQLGINAAEFQIAEQDGDRVPDFVQCEEGPSRARGRNKKLYTS